MNGRRFAALGLAAVLAVGLVEPAAAYIGPGAGLSMVGAFWGLLVAVFAAVGFILFWPIRRLMKRNRARPADASLAEAAPAEAERRNVSPGATSG